MWSMMLDSCVVYHLLFISYVSILGQRSTDLERILVRNAVSKSFSGYWCLYVEVVFANYDLFSSILRISPIILFDSLLIRLWELDIFFSLIVTELWSSPSRYPFRDFEILFSLEEMLLEAVKEKGDHRE